MNTFLLVSIVELAMIMLVSYKLYGLLKKVPQLASNSKAFWTVLGIVDVIAGLLIIQLVAALLFWIQWLVLALLLVGVYYVWRWLRSKTGGKGGRG